MRSYPNLIPLRGQAIQAILERIDPFAYDRVYGGWWGRNIMSGARESISASAERYATWAATTE